MNSHKIGDYLQKNGNVYKIVPFQAHNEELSELGFLTTFLKADTKEMFAVPFVCHSLNNFQEKNETIDYTDE